MAGSAFLQAVRAGASNLPIPRTHHVHVVSQGIRRRLAILE